MQFSRSLAPLALALVAATTTLAAQTTDSMKHDSTMNHSNMGAMHDDMMMGKPASFSATNGHGATGTVIVTGKSGMQKVEFSKDFTLTGAPDPELVLASGDAPDAGSLWVKKLSSSKGWQSYDLPASTDVSKFTKVLLWSKSHNTVVARADLATGEMKHM
ncbi:MAG: DM13 domain-containing protein [Gemmatimonadota bacterium]